MSALTLSILTETFPGEGRAHAIGTWASIGGLGFGAGPVAGGILLSFFGWSSVFWVNVPVGAAGLALAALAVHESPDRRSRRLDVPGVVTSALGLTGVTLGLIESSSDSWGSLPVAVPLAAGVVLLAVFALWERRAAAPMVPPALLRARSFATACLANMLSTAGLTGAMFYLTLLYQDVHGWSVLRTGLSWLFMNIPFLITARQAGRMHARLSGAAIVGAGCLVAGISVVVLSVLDASTPFVVAAAGYVLWGIGFGTSTPGINHAAMRDVPSAVSGAASGVLNASRQVGTSVGLAVLGAIGTGATVSDWTAKATGFPAAVRAAASGQAQDVAGARIAAVTGALGLRYRDAAVQSFVHGYHLAVGAGAACLLAAALIAFIGLRARAESSQPGTPAKDAPVSSPVPAEGSPSPVGAE
jgi:predicted MFS family arabinose efflux permease